MSAVCLQFNKTLWWIEWLKNPWKFNGSEECKLLFAPKMNDEVNLWLLILKWTTVFTDQLHKKDEQILNLLEEKVKLFRDMCDVPDETGLHNRMLFRATPDDITKGEPIMNEALKEGETTTL